MHRPWVINTCLGILLGGLVFGVSYLFGVDGKISVLSISSCITVILIISGSRIESWFCHGVGSKSAQDLNILDSLLSRESVLPLFLGAALWTSGHIGWESITTVAQEKADLVFLILMFALVAEGIRESGYFKYVAHRVMRECRGNMERLILSMFIVCGILSYLFTNDIVILVMTPVILEICRRTQFKNSKLLLVSIFFAANAMAMGLLLGPPKNIIVAREFDLNFIEYAVLMLIPSIFMLLIGVIATQFVIFIRQSQKRLSESYTYEVLDRSVEFTQQMKGWGYLYIFTIIFVIANTFISISFFVAFILISPIAIYLVWRESNSHLWNRDLWKQVYEKLIARLPVQIFIFALVFFTIAAEFTASFSEAGKIVGFLVGSENQNQFELATWNIVVPGILANLLNDLPTSALISELIAGAGIVGPGGSENDIMIIQSLLVGLGVGAYLTPIGTLAALIWFHIMRNQGEDVDTPGWVEMFFYGLIYFIMTFIIMAICIPVMLPLVLVLLENESIELMDFIFIVMVILIYFLGTVILIRKRKIPLWRLLAALWGGYPRDR